MRAAGTDADGGVFPRDPRVEQRSRPCLRNANGEPADASPSHAADCSPPASGDGKTLAAIATAATKRDKAICKACGGADKACGGGDDVSAAGAGFTDVCPSVTVPFEQRNCGAVVDTLVDVQHCLDCVGEFDVDCFDRSAVPEFGALPASCR